LPQFERGAPPGRLERVQTLENNVLLTKQSEVVVRDPFRQTAPEPPYSAAASAFADELEAVMADGTHDLAGIAAALNARAPGAAPWTAERLAAELATLASA
jgi:hypothetical protein